MNGVLIMRCEIWDLTKLKERASRQESEYIMMRNVFSDKNDLESFAKHSVV